MSKLKPHRVEQHENGSSTEHYRVSTLAEAETLAKRATSYYAHAAMSGYMHSTEEQYKPSYWRGCPQLTKDAMRRFLCDVLEHAGSGGDMYVNVRLYTYVLPGRYNHKTMREGQPRRRTSFYIG